MSKKQKNILLVLGFVFVLFICYKFAISNTVEQKRQYKSLSQEALLYKNAPKQLSLLRKKEAYYDSLLTEYQLDGSSIQNNLLKTINVFAEENDLKVVNFLEPHVIEKNHLLIKTYEFVLEGNYNSINKLIYKLEQQTKFGEVI
ncbi:MAG: hypothetical protein KDC67_15365, partial [Ignavibacteriae bacterium]|nr:hypothetical protein [Ignavibacteriota bacterium]